MTYTPLRLLPETIALPAKAATPAKVRPETTPPEPPAVAALAALAAAHSRTNNSADLAARAAIIAEGASVPVDWAEGFASLEAMPAPTGVSPSAWLAMINAAGRFLDQWGSRAAALGWTAAELFGLDPDAPMNRYDRRGAAFFLARAEVLAITAEEITLRVGTAIQRITRLSRINCGPPWRAPPAKDDGRAQ